MASRPPTFHLRPPAQPREQRKAWSDPSSAAHLRIRGRKGVEVRRQLRTEEPLCRMCLAEGRVSATTEVDHIVSLANGGSNDRANLQGLCLDHHKAKTIAERQAGRGGSPF